MRAGQFIVACVVCLGFVTPATAQEASAVAGIRTGLESADPPVKLAALDAVARRVAGARAGGTAGTAAARGAERRALAGVRPLVIEALQDTEPDVRRAAITALANLDTAEAVGGTERLSAAVMQRLVTAFANESDAAVQLEIVRVLAVSGEATPAVRQVLEQAANDPAPGLQQYGALGLTRLDAAQAR